MASSSTTNQNHSIVHQTQSTQISFTFATTVKLDRSNFLLWRKKVLTSIRGNRLERFISENQNIPEQYLSQARTDGSVERTENPAYVNWRAHDQTLLSWLFSTISEGILSSILNYDTSFDVWKSIEKQFGVQSEAKVLANKLACAGDNITEKDLLIRTLNGLGSGYLDLTSIITANKMNYDDAYALLLTHEGIPRRNAYGNGSFGQFGRRGQNFGRGMFFTSYPRGFPAGSSTVGGFGRGHATGFGRNQQFTHHPRSPHVRNMFSPINNSSSSTGESKAFTLPEAYVANLEDSSNEGWYLDSGATHHITNNMANMHVREEFKGLDQLTIGMDKDSLKGRVLLQGYSPSHKAYKCLHPSGQTYIARHVIFDENLFTYSSYSVFTSNSSNSCSNLPFTSQQVYHLSTLLMSPISNDSNYYNHDSAKSTSSNLHHSGNSAYNIDSHSLPQTVEPHTEPEPYISPPDQISLNTIPYISAPEHTQHIITPVNTHSMTTRSKAGIFKPKLYNVTLVYKEPESVKEAMENPKWFAAMKDEYNALINNNTWSLGPRSAGQKIVGNKWVFRVKQNFDGSLAKYKVRLVAKGFQQIEGVNCFETFSPVVKSATVRVVISLAVMKQWEIRQFDVNNDFLNGELTEEVFMDQPTGFVRPYSAALETFIAELSRVFALKDLGNLSYFLGIEVLYDAGCIYLSQRKYIRDLLSKVQLLECKGIDIPMSTGIKLQKETSGHLGQYVTDPTHYRSIVKGMQYLIQTRPEITFVVNKLSQYVSTPTMQHLVAYWACDLDDRKSVGAYCIYLGNNLMSWSSKKQSVIARSSAESEYRALASASAEIS
ncbi:retrovirus-related pol polyprotein from transposon RE2 [Citrus sinensis]|nr:retrovirus-related pol polyprotein from transposon RE2 [Citrus sinensis]